MGPFDRILVAISSLVISILSAVGLLELYSLLPPIAGPHALPAAYREPVAGGMAVLLLIGMRLLWLGLSRERKLKQAVVDDNSLGQVRVALTAIEALINKDVSRFPGVREVHSQVIGDPEGIAIKLKATVTPEISIPEVSKSIQQQVQDRVMEFTGIKVAGVKILVENISTTKPRVE